MMEAKIIDRKSWLVWLNRVFLAVAVTMIISIARGSVTMALSSVGPSSWGDRYNLTSHSTHPYTELEIPIYFKDNPGSVGVQVFDTQRSPHDWGSGAVFNGGARIYGDGHFTVSGFSHDTSTGYWIAWIHAYLIGSTFQFRLRLDKSDGIIAYATGRASQASANYNFDMGDISGPFETKEMQMALPCSFTQPTPIGPNSQYHLRLHDLDSWVPWRWHNNGMKSINVQILDETDGVIVREYHGKGNECEYHGPTCMGENGILDVDMIMYPGHKYKVLIGPTWKNNLIEYELPFDNIFYNISCEPNIDMRTTVDFTKKPTGDPKKQPRTGYKWLSSYGKYNSKDKISTKIEDQSIAEVMGYPGTNKLWTWTGNYPHVIENLPKAVMDKSHHKAELYPGDELTWWFRAYNVSGSGFDSSPSTDFANYREGWIDSRPPGWNWNQTKPEPTWGVNVFMPTQQGGPLNGDGGTHRQVMWGCYNNNRDEKCTDYGFNNSGFRFNSNYPDEGVFVTKQEAVDKHYRYIVKSGDAGQTLCQWLRMSWNNGSWQQRFTPKACVKIPYHYPPPPEEPPGKDKHSGVVPTTSAREDKVQAGDTVTFDYRVENPTGPTKTRPFEYHNYTFILKRGASLPEDKKDRPTYPKFWDGKGVSCKGGRSLGQRWNDNPSLSAIYPCVGWDTGATGVVLNVGESHTSSKSYGIYGSDWLAQPGDKICSYIAVDNNWSVTNDEPAKTFRASNIACVVVTKSPNLNLSGSDSYAKDGFTGSDVRENIVPGTDKRGSYSQYGLLTGDTDGVVNFGSAGYTIASPANRHLACKLSYANTDKAQGDCNDLKWLKPAGLSKNPLSTPSSTNAQQLPGGSSVNLSGLSSGSYKIGSGSLNINGYLKASKHITIFAEQADVTITGDIDAYTGPYHKLSEIPSFTIKAKNIKVDPGVKRITGTYVATGKFESCKGARNKSADLGMLPPPKSKCQNKLKVNGAIVSGNSPIFRRTFGAGNLPYDSQWDPSNISSTAEWINYTPNLWLTTSNGSSGNKLEGLTTTQVTNLPVRY